jgi:glutaredoxin
LARFTGYNAQVLGVSVDSVPCLRAWAENLGNIDFPLLSDFWPHGAVARQYGVLMSDGRSERAIFLVDKAGVIRYIDIHDIDEQPDNEVLFTELSRLEPDRAAQMPAAPQVEELPGEGIVMYCTPWCPDCRRARTWLEDRGLSYTEVDIYEFPQAAARLRELADGYLITPTFDIGGEIVLDFDEQKLREVLE